VVPEEILRMAEAAVAAEASVPKEAKKKGKGMLFLIIGVVALAAGAGAFFFLGSSKDGEAGHAAAPAHGESGGHGAAAPAEARGVVSLEPFIVNLADAEGDRYIKCTMRIVLDSKEAAEAVRADELSVTKIRDRMLTLLSSKSYGQVASAEGKEALRQEIQKQIDPVLAKGKVAEVYYTEFIVQ
jgi:flagellar FliL protein